MTISRRAVFMAGAGVLATGLISADDVTGWGGNALPIKIAGGQQGGAYLEFAMLLAVAINAAERRLNCTTQETDGSVQNILLIGRGDAHIGITQADAALAAFEGQAPFEAAIPLRAIGRVYQNYLQLVVHRDSRLEAVTDLAGKKVWVGPKGSGTAMFSNRLLDVAELRVDRRSQQLQEATAALEKSYYDKSHSDTSGIDAMLWLGGVPTPALAELHGRIGINLLPTAKWLPKLRSRYGTVYRPATIPPGSYGKPGTETIGVANLLVCADTLADDIAAAVARVLIDRAAQLVLPQTLGAQFLDSGTLIGTLGVPMHPGAANVYRHQHR